ADGAAAGADGRGGGAPDRREEGRGVHGQPRAAVRAGLPDPDRGLTAAEWLARCMGEAVADGRIWRRGRTGRLCNGERCELAHKRREVWTLMRRPMPVTGLVMSYPEVAAACGLT